jgi:hypothetical protein
MAISGASGGKYGVAGSVAVNVTSGATEGQLLADAVLTSQDGTADGNTAIGAITVNAASTTYSLANATPKQEPASGKKPGLGLSFAINVSNNDTRTTMEETAAVLAADDLSLTPTATTPWPRRPWPAKAGRKCLRPAPRAGHALNDTSSLRAR